MTFDLTDLTHDGRQTRGLEGAAPCTEATGERMSARASAPRLVPESVLELLACPTCQKYPLAQYKSAIGCVACGARYPVQDGIPLLVPPDWESTPEGVWGAEEMVHWERTYADMLPSGSVGR